MATVTGIPHVDSFLSGDAGWTMREEWYEQRGVLRRRPWKCQLWVNAELDRWIVLRTAPRGRKATLDTGEGIDRIVIKAAA